MLVCIQLQPVLRDILNSETEIKSGLIEVLWPCMRLVQCVCVYSTSASITRIYISHVGLFL